jgi:hypothetical protein
VSISRIKYQYQDNDKEGNQNCQAYHANAEIAKLKYQYQDIKYQHQDKVGRRNCSAYHANAEIAKLARLIMQMLKLPSSSINIKML